MVGYSEMFEVALWVQTTQEARVKIAYWEEGNSALQFYSNQVTTEQADAFTAKIIIHDLLPGKVYGYMPYINGWKVKKTYPFKFQTQSLWQHRTDPPEFSFVVGSCNYVNDPLYDRPGEPYGKSQSIFTVITEKSPDFMLWLGDNIYLREPDWGTLNGIINRYSAGRSVPELQPLLGSTHHYAIWDDHDYGPNNSDRSFRNKRESLDVFKLFWLNPTYGTEDESGITTSFAWGDVDFFLLDNRWFRSPNGRQTGDRTILGSAQLQWLIDGLSSSRAPFKIIAIGGQVLNPAAKYENMATYPDERAGLLDLIEKEKIKGVMFLTGDRHHTELTKLDRAGSYPLYDLTVSPLTATPSNIAGEEVNNLRVDGTLVTVNNFALLKVTGAKGARSLLIQIHSAEGSLLWERTIPEGEVK